VVKVKLNHPFDQLVQKDDSNIRLAEAALLFASDHCPDLNVELCLGRMDALARRVDRLAPRSSAEQAEALRAVLVEEEGFRGNAEDYDDPRNSLLNEILDRRLGLPIMLSAIWLDITTQLGWPFAGVGLPGHYIIKWETSKGRLLVDPFGGGRILNQEECARLVGMATGQSVALIEAHFQATTTKATLARMLNNLYRSYLQREAWISAIRVLHRLLALNPGSTELRLQLTAVTGQLAKLH